MSVEQIAANILEQPPAVVWEIGYEHAGNAAIKAAVNHLADLVKVFDWWGYGDGYGGALQVLLVEAVERRGIVVGPVQSWSPSTTVQTIAARDGWHCHYCSGSLGWGDGLDRPELDHVMPKSRGGGDNRENLVLSCQRCNAAKRAQTPAEWRGEYCCVEHEAVR